MNPPPLTWTKATFHVPIHPPGATRGRGAEAGGDDPRRRHPERRPARGDRLGGGVMIPASSPRPDPRATPVGG
jgi:hypothetical protein